MAGFAKPLEDEIIEDSEPEREEQRVQKKLRRKATNKKAEIRHDGVDSFRRRVPPDRRLQDHSIIVISDESDIPPDVAVLAQQQSIKKKPQVVAEEQSSKQLTSARVGDDPSLTSPPQFGGNDDGETASPVTGRETPDSSGEHASTSEKARRMPDLARYAYTSSRASSVSVVSRPSVYHVPSAISRHASSSAIVAPPVTKPKPVASHRFTAVEDSDLTRLRKCVSCELSWTSRKTVLQKMKHIQTCAKKNKLDDDTVIMLIRTELANANNGDASGSKQSGAGTKPTATTLLENAVQEVVPRKRGRRPKVVESVMQLSETRQNILDRARLLLLTQPAPAEQLVEPSASSNSLPAAPPLLTQPFGESALAQKYRPKCTPEPPQTSLAISDSSPSAAQHPLVDSSPPMGFGGSNLAKQFPVKMFYPDLNSSPVRIPSPLAQRNQDSDTVRLSPTPHRLDLPDDRTLGLDGERTDNHIALSSPLHDLLRHGSANGAGPSYHSVVGPIPANASQNIYLQQESAIARMCLDLGQNAEFAEDVHLETDVNYDQQVAYSDRENDDAMLHHDPDNFGTHQYFDHVSQSSSSFSLSSLLGIPPPTRPSSPLIPDDDKGKSKETVKKKRRSPTQIPSPRPPTPSDSDSPVQAPRSPTTKGKDSRSKQTKTDTTAAATKSTKPKRVQITDEELFAHLKDSILQDTQLYLRILRYEPIDINVFLEMATDYGAPSRGLLLRVRAFLDKQAIHFYGPVVSRRRTKPRSRKP